MDDVIETASTGRAKCRRCQQQIEKGALRFGERVPNPFGEGDATHWYHLACAAEKRPQKLEPALQRFPADVPNRERIEAIVREGVDNPKLWAILRAERAASGRATCQECHEKIAKDELRIAFEREAEATAMAASSFVHAKCGPAHFGRAGLLAKLERTTGELDATDFAELKAALG